MFDDIIIDKKKVYKERLNEKIQNILDSFKLEPDDSKTRSILYNTLQLFLEEEKKNKRIQNYLLKITEKNIKIEVNV